jgi:hypothetical protein
MIDHKIFIKKARYLQEPIPSAEQIDNALAQYDVTAMTQTWRNKLTVQIWDGVSNVNAATPEYIKESNPWADKVYLILIDGKITFMQTHEPFVNGYVPLTTETVEVIANAHADKIASNSAYDEITNLVMSDLGLNE